MTLPTSTSSAPATAQAPKKPFFAITKKKVLKTVKIGLGISVLLAVASLARAIKDYVMLNKNSSELTELSHYETTLLKTNSLTKDIPQEAKTLSDVITTYQDILSEKTMSIEYFANLQKPYEHALQYILFPSMNIWKNRYSDAIDTSIIGQQYLEKNPYVDNNLISTWTDFFRDIGRNTQYNEINDITIGTISENENGSFTLPIDVSFSSSNKRSFLMLVDKLSITSNRGNISLINEFLYNLWEQLKQQQIALSGSMLSGDIAAAPVSGTIDDQIGKGMYERLYTTGNANFVTEEIVDKAVLQTVGCSENSQDFCYFKFREKFRSIPLLAYNLGFSGSNNALQLRAFLRYLPPVINVKQFSFEKKSAGVLSTSDQYVGKIRIEVFGRAISEKELGEIALAIGKKCFVADKAMSPDSAIQYLQENTKQFGDIARLSNEKSKDLADLSLLFTQIKVGYDKLPRYKKAVKLFELYRMLDDTGLCGTQ